MNLILSRMGSDQANCLEYKILCANIASFWLQNAVFGAKIGIIQIKRWNREPNGPAAMPHVQPSEN